MVPKKTVHMPQDAPQHHTVSGVSHATFSGCLALVGLIGIMVWIVPQIIAFSGFADTSPRLPPNTSIQGLSFDGQTSQYATHSLRAYYADFIQHPITLVYHGTTWQPTAQQLGITLDVTSTIRHAARPRTSDTPHDYPLIMHIDQPTMQAYLLSIAPEIEHPPRNATVQLDGHQVEILPESVGVQMLVDHTIAVMMEPLSTLHHQRLTLPTRLLHPSIRQSDLAPIATQLRTILQAPIVLTGTSTACHGGICRWVWHPTHIAQWLRIQETPHRDGHRVRLLVDQNAIRADLLPIAQTVQQRGTLPRVNWTTEQGPMIFQPGQPGIGLNMPLALHQIDAALRGGSRTITLGMTAIPPPISEANLATLNLQEALGVGVSSFRGSEAYRVTNIREGARRMHGILIPPGDEFTFNGVLGTVDGSTGFVPGAIIKQDRIQQEWGGGLCQVSTTMFRAAFWSGLPITERHEHSFRIPWYEELGEPPGFDAAIYTGWHDLRFVNDTGQWLLTQTWVDLNRQRLFISLYGPPSNRTITIGHQVLATTPPLPTPRFIDDPTQPAGHITQTDWASGGLTVDLYRTVRMPNDTLRHDTFRSVFQSRADVYVRGTAP